MNISLKGSKLFMSPTSFICCAVRSTARITSKLIELLNLVFSKFNILHTRSDGALECGWHKTSKKKSERFLNKYVLSSSTQDRIEVQKMSTCCSSVIYSGNSYVSKSFYSSFIIINWVAS